MRCGSSSRAPPIAAALPHLHWQTSDRPENLPGIRQWLTEAALPNTPPPLALDVSTPWPAARFDAAFSANTLHIMGWPEVEALFASLPAVLTTESRLTIYGPFNYNGRFSSDSNAAFDAALKADDPRRGIRDFEAVDALARHVGFHLIEDKAMPANNRCLSWQRHIKL